MALFLKILEWTDDSNDTLVYKLPTNGRDINHKSKLIVRESQQAIFVHKGKVCDVFTPGTYSLNTDILPILSKLAGWMYAFQTPISVDVYFINTKQFTGYKWGTANPIMMRDPEFGAIRVKGYGSYAFKVDDATKFMTELFGTNSSFKTKDITDWLKTMIVSAMTDTLGESKVSALDLAGNTLEFNQTIKDNIEAKFNEIGLTLTNLFIENMSVPEEVEKAIDERTKLGILGDKTDVMMKIAAAEAMKEAAKNEGMGGGFMSAGVGMGAGLGMGALFADAMRSGMGGAGAGGAGGAGGAVCGKCGEALVAGAKFCGKCGTPVGAGAPCSKCGKPVPAGSKFCPDCGTPVARNCSKCGKALPAGSKFCPDCGTPV